MGGLCVVHIPYALTYQTTLHTFEETQRCQLYHYNVVVIQLAALGFFTSIQGTPFKAMAKQAWLATLLAAAECKSSEANTKLQTFLGVGTMDLEPCTPNDGFYSPTSCPLAPSVGGLQDSVGPAQVISESHAGWMEGTSPQESGKPPDGSQFPFTPTVPNSIPSPRGLLPWLAQVCVLNFLP